MRNGGSTFVMSEKTALLSTYHNPICKLVKDVKLITALIDQKQWESQKINIDLLQVKEWLLVVQCSFIPFYLNILIVLSLQNLDAKNRDAKLKWSYLDFFPKTSPTVSQRVLINSSDLPMMTILQYFNNATSYFYTSLCLDLDLRLWKYHENKLDTWSLLCCSFVSVKLYEALTLATPSINQSHQSFVILRSRQTLCDQQFTAYFGDAIYFLFCRIIIAKYHSKSFMKNRNLFYNACWWQYFPCMITALLTSTILINDGQ